MCAVTHIGLSLISFPIIIKISLGDVIGTQQSAVPVKPLCNTSINIFISPLSMLYLQKGLLIHLKRCIHST